MRQRACEPDRSVPQMRRTDGMGRGQLWSIQIAVRCETAWHYMVCVGLSPESAPARYVSIFFCVWP